MLFDDKKISGGLRGGIVPNHCQLDDEPEQAFHMNWSPKKGDREYPTWERPAGTQGGNGRPYRALIRRIRFVTEKSESRKVSMCIIASHPALTLLMMDPGGGLSSRLAHRNLRAARFIFSRSCGGQGKIWPMYIIREKSFTFMNWTRWYKLKHRPTLCSKEALKV